MLPIILFMGLVNAVVCSPESLEPNCLLLNRGVSICEIVEALPSNLVGSYELGPILEEILPWPTYAGHQVCRGPDWIAYGHSGGRWYIMHDLDPRSIYFRALETGDSRAIAGATLILFSRLHEGKEIIPGHKETLEVPINSRGDVQNAQSTVEWLTNLVMGLERQRTADANCPFSLFARASKV